MIDKHTLALGAAVGATGVEIFCVYDGLRDASAAQLAAGVAIAILAPLVPAYIEGARRYFATVVFVATLACIIVASGGRVGHFIDQGQQQREAAARAAKLAADTEAELATMLAEARAVAKTACGLKPTKACTDSQKRVDGLQGKLAGARSALATAPSAAGNGDVARIAAWTGGLLSEGQVSLYLPLLWPVTMALVGAFFWGVWGDGRPKTTPVVELKAAEPAEASLARPQIAVEPSPAEVASMPATAPALAAPNVVRVLGAILQPADRRKRVEIEDVLRSYMAACKANGNDVAPLDAFAVQAKAFAEATGIRVLTSGGKVFWCGVKLVA